MKRQLLPVLLIGAAAFAACEKLEVLNPTKTLKGSKSNEITKNVSTIGGATMLTAPVAESKVYKLLEGYDSGDKFEASGVQVQGGYFYTVFDNRYKIGKLKNTLPQNSSQNSMLSSGFGDSGFEGIAYDDNNTPNFFVVEETVQNGSVYQPRIREYDASMVYQNSLWCEYNFTSSNANKGFEGIAWVFRGGEDYTLGLVEGTGKVVVLKKTSTKWAFVQEITLPSSVTFNDFSDIAVYGNKVAITSQEDSQVWIGTLSSTTWSITGGTAYTFPTGSSAGVVGPGGYKIYGNIEGVSFISNTQIVVVSDKAKDDQPTYQTYKDQSVHIFNIP